MKFPNTETGIYELAQVMSSGLNAHTEDFPNISQMEFGSIIQAYTTARNTSDIAKSGAKVAVAGKGEKLEELVEEMKKILKQAEVDVADNPAKLAEIGWGPRNEPTPLVITVPDAPTNLSAIFDGESTLSLQLSWKKPEHDPNKPVVNYVILRRDRQAGGEFGEWYFCDMTYKTQTALIGQPKGVAMEYRVKATNAAGASVASNSVAVIL